MFMQTAILILASVMKTKSHGGTTEQEVVTAIQSCLKYAPDRRGGGGRKKRASEN